MGFQRRQSVLRTTVMTTVLNCAGVLMCATASAQGGNPAPATVPDATGAPPQPPALAASAPAAAATAPPSAPAPIAKVPVDDLTGAIGFGVGVVPSSTLVGTTGAVG